MPEDEFRLRVRDIFEREYPAELRNPPRRLRWSECRAFYRRLGEELGLLALAWPKEFGGSAVTPRKQLVFMQEQDRWGVARAPDMGITMVGPGLIRYGTPEQQRRYMPVILAFEQMWCQGFSEPGAGSDLASLRTKAVRDGSEFVIDGGEGVDLTIRHQHARRRTCSRPARRTDTVREAGQAEQSQHVAGRPATSASRWRPLRDIAGQWRNSATCTSTACAVPADCLLGRENEGWTVAKTLLANERIYLGNPRQPQYALKRVDAIAARLGLAGDPVFMARLTQLRLDVWDLASLYERFAEQVRRGEPIGPDVSILKLFGSETYRRLSELAVEALGSAGALAGDVLVGGEPDNVMSLFLNSRPRPSMAAAMRCSATSSPSRSSSPPGA